MSETRSARILSAASLTPRSINEEARTIEYLASDETLDSHGTIVTQDWDLTRYARNPVVLWGHDPDQPIGTADVRVTSEGLVATVRYATGDALADRIWNLARQGVVRGISVGFRSSDYRVEKRDGVEIYVLSGNVLFELSNTSLPSNPNGLAREAEVSFPMSLPASASPAVATPAVTPPAVVPVADPFPANERAALPPAVDALVRDLTETRAALAAQAAQLAQMQAHLSAQRDADLVSLVDGFSGRKFAPAGKDAWLTAARSMGRESFVTLMGSLPDMGIGARVTDPTSASATRATDSADAARIAAGEQARTAALAAGASPVDAAAAAFLASTKV